MAQKLIIFWLIFSSTFAIAGYGNNESNDRLEPQRPSIVQAGKIQSPPDDVGLSLEEKESLSEIGFGVYTYKDIDKISKSCLFQPENRLLPQHLQKRSIKEEELINGFEDLLCTESELEKIQNIAYAAVSEENADFAIAFLVPLAICGMQAATGYYTMKEFIEADGFLDYANSVSIGALSVGAEVGARKIYRKIRPKKKAKKLTRWGKFLKGSKSFFGVAKGGACSIIGGGLITYFMPTENVKMIKAKQYMNKKLIDLGSSFVTDIEETNQDLEWEKNHYLDMEEEEEFMNELYLERQRLEDHTR